MKPRRATIASCSDWTTPRTACPRRGNLHELRGDHVQLHDRLGGCDAGREAPDHLKIEATDNVREFAGAELFGQENLGFGDRIRPTREKLAPPAG